MGTETKSTGEENGKPPESNETGNPDNSADKGSNGSSPPSSENDSLREMVREEIANALKDFKGSNKGESSGGSRSVERVAREAVEAEAARVFKEKAHEEEHKKLVVKPAEPEKIPGKGKFLTRLLWGDPES